MTRLIEVTIRVRDTLHQRVVDGGAEIVHGPDTRPWGRMATYRDPDGNLVSVSQRPK